jgi:nucleotide-binding universal stress UspA family protein
VPHGIPRPAGSQRAASARDPETAPDLMPINAGRMARCNLAIAETPRSQAVGSATTTSGVHMKILLAVDGSPISKRAATHVAKLAKQLASPPTVFLFNADQPLMQSVAVKLGLEAVTRYHAENGEYAVKAARTVLKRAHVDCSEKFVVGEPVAAIIKFAKANRCDLIVMGSQGHSALKSLLIGSVTAKVIAHCDIPVMVAR